MSVFKSLALALGAAALMSLGACVGVNSFKTYYDAPLSRAETSAWRVSDVRVAVPRSLSVSEEQSYEPVADIVWREDPRGDRYAQVQKIMTDAIRQGASGLHGGRSVRLDVTMQQFHAMTFEAESIAYDVGVHNVRFTISVVDAASGTVLKGPVEIDASLPAMSGARMAAARAAGDSQRKQISRHVAATIAGWLGTGPDNRMTFMRAGR